MLRKQQIMAAKLSNHCIHCGQKGYENMKKAIVYYSRHHENTKKLLDELAKNDELTLIDASQTEAVRLEEYDLIGFASGIYYSKFHKSVLKLAESCLPEGKRVFFVYTYGAKKEGYTNAIRKTVLNCGADILGEYGCFGFNTFGPFKLIGGMAKGHPDAGELSGVVKFYSDILSKCD